MTDDETRVFNSYPEYRVFADSLVKDDPVKVAKNQQLRHLCTIYEQSLAQRYDVDPVRVLDVVAIFGTIGETNKRIAKESVRDLLFDINNIVVLEHRVTALTIYTIATIYTSEGHEQISTLIGEAVKCRTIRET
jgi:hypothetical protein